MGTGDKISFGALKTELKALIWPNGVPENLVAPIDKSFEDAFMDLQTYVKCLQEWHTDVVPQCATYFKCGLTVLDKPRGKIRRIRTFQSQNFCDPVTLTPATVQEVYCWSRRFMERVTPPANVGLPTLPMGFRFADASTDSEWGRALTGLYTFDRDRIYVAPWIQSLEVVVVEWDGFKRKFADTDLFPDEQDLKRALRLYVQSEYSRDFERDFTSKREFKKDYEDARADLIYKCEEEQRLPQAEECESERESLWDHRTEDDSPETEEHPTIIALFGDYGTDDETATMQVAALVKGWGASAIVTLGDNNYQGGATGTYDQSVGRAYASMLYPYSGTQELWCGETAATENKFWPALGNHDNDYLADYVAFFGPNLPKNDRFYDVVIGPVHFFVLNCGVKTDGTLVESAGNDALSVQAAWFRDRVATSLSRWKVAIVHQPPYSSFRSPGYTGLRWIKGVDLVISGHNHHYERLSVDGQTYLIAGTGGAGLYSFGGNVTGGSLVRYDDANGALRMTATCDGLKVEFINVSGEVIDTIRFGSAVTGGGAGGSGSGGVVPPVIPSLPPGTFRLIQHGEADPRYPKIVPGSAEWPGGDPSVWGIYLQTVDGASYNTWYWSPSKQDYI